MTVTYLPGTQHVHDESARQNFEYLEAFGLFLDQSGAGPVLQLGSAQNRHVSFGLINGAAGTLSMSSGDVTLVRNAVGNYTINNAKFPASFVVVATPTTSGSAFAMSNVTTIAGGTFTLEILNSSTGAAVDSFVSFVAIY